MEMEMEIKELMVLLSQRADSYASWIEVGMCLYHINTTTMLDTWIKFSKQSECFRDGECEEMWVKFADRDIYMGLGNLHLWAKYDSPDAYENARARWLQHIHTTI